MGGIAADKGALALDVGVQRVGAGSRSMIKEFEDPEAFHQRLLLVSDKIAAILEAEHPEVAGAALADAAGLWILGVTHPIESTDPAKLAALCTERLDEMRDHLRILLQGVPSNEPA